MTELSWPEYGVELAEYNANLRWTRKYRIRDMPDGNRRMVIYVLESSPGDTFEDKAYGIIAAGFDDSGYEPPGLNMDDELTDEHLDKLVRACYRIVAVREHRYAAAGGVIEYEIVIEGNADDIDEYLEALKELE